MRVADCHPTRKHKAHGLCGSCYSVQWRNNNPTKVKDYQKHWDQENKERKRYLWAAWYEQNKEEKLQQSREWKRKNRDKLQTRQRVRTAEDIEFRLGRNLRSRTSRVVSGELRGGSAVNDLGCSLEELKQHLENQFQDDMTWDNYGKWHIDHILPLSKFDLKDRDQFLKAAHYTNLQPLWALDNLRKGASLGA